LTLSFTFLYENKLYYDPCMTSCLQIRFDCFRTVLKKII